MTTAATPLSVPQVAAIFGISKATVHRRIADGTFPIKPHLEGPSKARRFPAGLVHFYATFQRQPETMEELADFIRLFPLDEVAS